MSGKDALQPTDGFCAYVDGYLEVPEQGLTLLPVLDDNILGKSVHVWAIMPNYNTTKK
jgi:hypothetical protein